MSKIIKLFSLALLLVMFCFECAFAATYPCDGQVLKNAVNVRKKASQGSDQVGKLKQNEIVTVIGEEANGNTVWYQIEFGKGKTGYVRSDLIMIVPTSNLINTTSPIPKPTPTLMPEKTINALEGEIYSTEDSRYSYRILKDGTAEIVYMRCDSREVVIPDRIDGYIVSSLSRGIQKHGNSVFAGQNLKKLVIPETLVSFDETSLQSLGSLESIVVSPDNPVYATIDNALFHKEEKKLIYCPKNAVSYTVPQGIEKIGSFAFDNCVELKELTIPDSVVEIEEGALKIGWAGSDKAGLQAIKVSSNNPYYFVENNALYCRKTNRLIRCAVEQKECIIPQEIKTIDPYAFSACELLESVDIPNGLTQIGDYAFTCCLELKAIDIPDSVSSIGEHAFRACLNLESINLPSEIRSIPSYMLDECINLKNVSLPVGITSIEKGAFWGCRSLESIVIPDGVTFIDEFAFRECRNLESIVIPDSVTSIGNQAFAVCDKLTRLVIPDSVIDIGKAAFDGSIVLMVGQNSYAKQYAEENGITYSYPDDISWLTGEMGSFASGNSIVTKSRETPAPTATPKSNEPDYTSLAAKAVKKTKDSLVNPASIQVHSIQIRERNGEQYLVIDFSAMNGFGGYGREKDVYEFPSLVKANYAEASLLTYARATKVIDVNEVMKLVQ